MLQYLFWLIPYFSSDTLFLEHDQENSSRCEIWSCRGGESSDCGLVGYNAVRTHFNIILHPFPEFQSPALHRSSPRMSLPSNDVTDLTDDIPNYAPLRFCFASPWIARFASLPVFRDLYATFRLMTIYQSKCSQQVSQFNHTASQINRLVRTVNQ
jgi:hypothetical protein